MIEEVDIVLTTYHTLVVDFDDKSNPIHTVEWFRVVLDEGNEIRSQGICCIATDVSPAHIIRRQVTTFYRAVSELKARSRWCLTGTPIQNRLEDVGALFAFIRASLFHSITMFRKFVTVPFDESEERRAVATRNLTLLLDSLCLRRSRELLHLPEPQERIIQVDFSQEERNQYEQTKKMMNRALRERVGESHSKKAFGMFQVQLQLRILCNHGTYQHPFSWNKRTLLDEREDALCLVGDSGEVICSACRQPMPILGSNKVYRTYAENCAHILCSECLDENEEISGDTGEEVMRCPLCSLSGVPFTTTRSGTVAEERHDSYLRAEGHSSKMSALVSDIKQDLWTTKRFVTLYVFHIGDADI
jgi:SWI/SNF-related matrix-associated actin-dependent regulator of chromatin subfamily A3